MIKLIYRILLIAIVIAVAFDANADSDSIFGYSVKRDIVYGQGAIKPEGNLVMRDLKMDVYSPTRVEKGVLLPAVVYVHGGGHHRGGRFLPPFRIQGVIHSAPQDYGRLLAAYGYVTFVVEYRLAPENPEPDHKPGEANLLTNLTQYVSPIMLGGTSRARTAMGLSALEGEEGRIFLWKAGIAGAEDVMKAVNYIIKHANDFDIDTKKIALGGHSAGAGITTNVAYGFKAPVAAIFPMSGPDIAFDKAKVLGPKNPPALIVYSQYDDETMLDAAPRMIKGLANAGAKYEVVWVPGFPHSYPSGAPTLSSDGTRKALLDRITDFLDKHVRGLEQPHNKAN